MDLVEGKPRALLLDPRLVSAHLNRGTTLWESRRFPEALEACERALELAPRSGIAQYGRGRSLEGVGESGEARKAYEAAFSLTLPESVREACLKRLEALRAVPPQPP